MKKAVIVISRDDINNYFLVIDLETGKEIKRTSTEQMGICRWSDSYNKDEVVAVAKIAASCNVKDYTVIRWY